MITETRLIPQFNHVKILYFRMTSPPVAFGVLRDPLMVTLLRILKERGVNEKNELVGDLRRPIHFFRGLIKFGMVNTYEAGLLSLRSWRQGGRFGRQRGARGAGGWAGSSGRNEIDPDL